MGQEPADWEVRRKVHVGTHYSGFDYLVRANDRVESPLSQGLCMKSIQASAQHVVAGEAHEAK